MRKYWTLLIVGAVCLCPYYTLGYPAEEQFLEKAEKGDAASQFLLGYCYMLGNNIPQNYKAAAKWMRKAAEQGHSEAQYHLSTLYLQGLGVPIDEANAEKWMRKSKEQGFSGADLSYFQFKKAAENGDAEAQYTVGLYYHTGSFLAKNEAEAVKWWRKAAKQGHEQAKHALKLYAPMKP